MRNQLDLFTWRDLASNWAAATSAAVKERQQADQHALWPRLAYGQKTYRPAGLPV